MRAEKLHQEVLISCVDFQSNTGFLCIGGDDISADSSPRSLVHRDHAKHLIMVNMLTLEHERMARRQSTKGIDKGTICKPPGLKKENFPHKKRNQINKHHKKIYGQPFATFPHIHFPDNHASSSQHLKN